MMTKQAKIPFRNFPVLVDEYLPESVKYDYENRQHDLISDQFEDLALLVNKYIDPTPKKENIRVQVTEAEQFTKMVKDYAKYLGASLVGITRLDQEKHVPYTGEVEINHKYAIALAFEANYDLLKTAPSYHAMRDYWKMYSTAAMGAVHLATFVREHGYEALAHHVRSHVKIGKAICMVPIAVDAGLGELGRNGVLITKEYGPRVRISVVTTSAPLLTDKPVDLGVDKFCQICKKCMRHCPTKAIREEKTEIRGVTKWSINPEQCIKAGARTYECTLCFKVCPWNKPNNLTHKMASYFAARSGIARLALNYMDDLIYGK